MTILPFFCLFAHHHHHRPHFTERVYVKNNNGDLEVHPRKRKKDELAPLQISSKLDNKIKLTATMLPKRSLFPNGKADECSNEKQNKRCPTKVITPLVYKGKEED